MEKAIFFNQLRMNIHSETLELLKNAGFSLIDISKQSAIAIYSQMCDLQNSWLIGDLLDDIETGNLAGCKTVLVANGAEPEWHITPIRQPHFISPNFEYAAQAVVLKSIYQMVQEQAI